MMRAFNLGFSSVLMNLTFFIILFRNYSFLLLITIQFLPPRVLLMLRFVSIDMRRVPGIAFFQCEICSVYFLTSLIQYLMHVR